MAQPRAAEAVATRSITVGDDRSFPSFVGRDGSADGKVGAHTASPTLAQKDQTVAVLASFI